jgi:hypothetical protein
MRLLARALVIICCLTGILGLCVWYGTIPTNPEMGPYPSTERYLSNQDAYRGELVTAGGFVETTDPVVIRATFNDGTVLVTLQNVETPVETGDKLRVFGRYQGGTTVRAKNVIHASQGGLVYTKSISFLAGMWILFRIVRHWRVDRDTVSIAPDSAPGRLLAGVRAQWGDD